MLTASNTEGSSYAYSFQYNGAGQVTSVTEPFAGASLSFGYDLAGNRTSVSDSFGGTESLGYDADNNLTTLTYGDASDSLSISFTYNQANQMTQEQMYSSGSLIATVAETYDGAGNVKNITYENSSSAVIDSFSYIYDQANELMSEMDSSGATTMNYTYNDLGELTAAGLQVYSYDAAGNPNSGADGLVGGSPSSAGNELSEYVVPSDIPTIAGDTITYTYDTAGNEMTAADLTASTTWSYGYDNANHITSAMETVSGTLTEAVGYVYDVFGNLIRETVVPYSGGMSGTPTTMDFLMDGWNPAKAGATGNAGFDTWAVLNGTSGLMETRNIQGNGIDQILARIDNASHGASDTGLFFDLTDRLGSVRYVLSSTSDTTVATINYDAWGNILTSVSTSMGMYAWDGYDYDAVTKLYLDNARDYDSVSERWLSQDPLGFDAGDSNLYRYVNNAPTNARDPSGLWADGPGAPLTDAGAMRMAEFYKKKAQSNQDAKDQYDKAMQALSQMNQKQRDEFEARYWNNRKATFLSWYDDESKAGLGWIRDLPPPPPHLQFRAWDGKVFSPSVGGVKYERIDGRLFGYIAILPSGGWVADSGDLSFYHPGAVYSIRRRGTEGLAGTQATYDGKGDLITGGLAAGTADKVCPVNIFNLIDVWGHVVEDVDPFKLAASLDRQFGGTTYRHMYIKVRPPINPPGVRENIVNEPGATQHPSSLLPPLVPRPDPRPGDPGFDDWALGKAFGIPASCFVAGTKIVTNKGTKAIEDIQITELVLSWNETTHEFEFKPVIQLIRAKKRLFVLIQGDGWSILCTLEHPFLVDGKWKTAGELVQGDSLLDANGKPIKVGSVNRMTSNGEIDVFNFTVQDNHTYCVTELGVVVHNK